MHLSRGGGGGGGGNPFRVIPLLGDSSPCRENIISCTGSVREDGSS